VFPEEWKRYDFIFAPYVAYGHLSELPGGCPTVCWWISQQNGWSNKTLEFWTNSRTTRDMLQRVCGLGNVHVIVPPYDYGIFRDRIESKDKRSFDIAYLARAHPDKDLETFCRTAKALDLRAVLAVLCKNAIQRQYALSLVDRYKDNVSLLMNADKATLAEFLGNTKVYFHPSRDESCSVAVYEALNAGCFPICRAAGAVREQLNGLGLIYHREDDPVPLVKLVLEGMDWDVLTVVRRGMVFDKNSVMRELKTRLREIEKCLP
jgi:glycosyltransferase involved in cell wall biosynthesis